MDNPIYYIPIGTTVLSSAFAWVVFRRYLDRGRPMHLLWWSIGIAVFGLGTFFEGYTALFGWAGPIFRGWYITGALMGGAPLALGTTYLLLSPRTADRIAVAVLAAIAISSVFVLLTPLDSSIAQEHKLKGDVIEWTWVRGFSPFINLYAVIFLIGGAILSAARYSEHGDHRRTLANVLIAVGATLPGIGGSFTRFGHTEVLYVTEFLGVCVIYAGYRLSTTGRRAEVAAAAPAVAG